MSALIAKTGPFLMLSKAPVITVVALFPVRIETPCGAFRLLRKYPKAKHQSLTTLSRIVDARPDSKKRQSETSTLTPVACLV
jgi:hypothetical protein